MNGVQLLSGTGYQSGDPAVALPKAVGSVLVGAKGGMAIIFKDKPIKNAIIFLVPKDTATNTVFTTSTVDANLMEIPTGNIKWDCRITPPPFGERAVVLIGNPPAFPDKYAPPTCF